MTTATPLPDLPSADQRVFLEAWAAYEALRRLGFLPEDLYLGIGVKSPEREVLHVILRVQAKEFVVTLGDVSSRLGQTRANWTRLFRELRELPETRVDELWKSSTMGELKTFRAMALSIMRKGIRIPCASGKLN